MGMNNNILRALTILSFIAINLLVIYGISSIYSYLNTGADRSKMLHTEIQKTDQYLPTINWSKEPNQGRKINKQSVSDIENDYLDAWYIKHISAQSNSIYGIEDYYTENARENIYALIENNLKEGIYIESTTLEHNPKIEFFSEDGQLVSLTDSHVLEYKRVFQHNQLIIETYEVSTYQMVLLLEDGFWRIRHKIKTESKELTNLTSPKLGYKTITDSIKGINYYPKLSPWDTFGDQYNADSIANDFKIIKTAGLNSIRVFVQYEDFGKANVLPEKIEKLKILLDKAEKEKLKVLVTLFDFYGDYSVINWSLDQAHAEAIVDELKNHPALLGWDIKNEPDLDFKSRGKEKVTAWLSNMIRFVNSIDSTHPTTIGWSKPNYGNILSDKVDFISFHYYEDLSKLASEYSKLKDSILNKSIVLTEFGKSSYNGIWSFSGNSDKNQASFHKDFQTKIKENNIPFMSWTLYDFSFVPSDVTGNMPWKKNPQKLYGFIDTNGNKKESFQYIAHP
jgi:hypothetical protein